MKSLLYALCAFTLIACQAEPANEPPVENLRNLPPVKDALRCLSSTGPIITLHRGRDKGRDQVENGLSSLQKAEQDGFIMAEIDIAQLKDGTLILFHDGVWDEKSTGQGAVAASDASDLDRILLKTPRGKLTDSRPARLDKVLSYAKGRLYLEIDFKSSADEKDVIDLIVSHNMEEQVILIAYSPQQAARLRKLAPDMVISISAPETKLTQPYLYWLGTSEINRYGQDAISDTQRITAYGQFSARRDLPKNWEKINILVTDYPLELRAKLKAVPDLQRLQNCHPHVDE